MTKEPAVGVEPTTCGLQNRCSTTELRWQFGLRANLEVRSYAALDGYQGSILKNPRSPLTYGLQSLATQGEKNEPRYFMI
jgi:hypothetical protein